MLKVKNNAPGTGFLFRYFASRLSSKKITGYVARGHCILEALVVEIRYICLLTYEIVRNFSAFAVES